METKNSQRPAPRQPGRAAALGTCARDVSNDDFNAVQSFSNEDSSRKLATDLIKAVKLTVEDDRDNPPPLEEQIFGEILLPVVPLFTVSDLIANEISGFLVISRLNQSFPCGVESPQQLKLFLQARR
jgi:hypothetical protein